MGVRNRSRTAASDADNELQRHLEVAERALIQAHEVVDRVARDRTPEAREMKRRAEKAQRGLMQAQAVIRGLGPLGSPDEMPQEPTKAERRREERKKAQREANRTKKLTEQLLASLEVDGGA